MSFLISAAHKSSGKTSISIGLCAAFRQQGFLVQPFKKGPDYIDPLWLGNASGRPCYSLDFYTMSHAEILANYQRASLSSDIAIVEGNKGLYDGLDLDGKNSNAALAKLLGLPVVLVLDARGMTRGVAPLILGYQSFDPDINIAGVILNKLGGSRHEGKLRAVIEHYTDVKVMGAVHFESELEIDERHLGLIPSNEHSVSQVMVDRLANVMLNQVDLKALKELGANDVLKHQKSTLVSDSPCFDHLSVAIPKDEAFGFYYAGDIEAFESAGVSIKYFDALVDAKLPEVDALFIGGGSPETQMQALSDNTQLRGDIATKIKAGLPAYAECGGLMYLSEKVTWGDVTCEMVGVIPGETTMCAKPQGRGYVKMEATDCFPWPGVTSGEVVSAHEFHYSKLTLSEPVEFAYRVKRGTGITGESDGLLKYHLLASYTHLRHVDQTPWVYQFLAYVDKCMQGNVALK